MSEFFVSLRRGFYRCSSLRLILCALYIMPFVDSLSGAFHDTYPIGKIYRTALFLFLYFVLANVSAKNFAIMAVSFVTFLVAQIGVCGGFSGALVSDLVKLFLPLVLIDLMWVLLAQEKIEHKNINLLINFWSVAYPILLIIPFLLKVGNSAYEDGVGSKGFFYSTNEISFIFSCLVMFRIWKLFQNLCLMNVLMLGLNAFCILLIGTKTGYITVALFAVIYGLSVLRKHKRFELEVLSFLVLALAFFVLLFSNKILLLLGDIIGRWQWQKQISLSLSDFLFSMRLRKLDDALAQFDGVITVLFGSGFANRRFEVVNMEMDFLDVLFRTGFLGFFFVISFYGWRMVDFFKKNFWGVMMTLWMLALSFGAGHVLFYGQSGMMLAVMFVLAKSFTKEYCFVNKESNSIIVESETVKNVP